MTIDELIESLPRDGWRLNKDGMLRRGECCPITCASGQPAYAWRVEMHRMGLPFSDAVALLGAADNARTMTPIEAALRSKLLEHCQITEAF